MKRCWRTGAVAVALCLLAAVFAAASAAEPITVGIIDNTQPLCYWDEQKQEYVGIHMEIMRAISEKTGLTFQYERLDLSEAPPVTHLKSGDPELVSGIVRTANFMNDPELLLSDTLMGSELVVVGRKGVDITDDPEHRTIALMAGFQVAREYAEERFPQYPKALFDTQDECMDAVASGRADATIYLSGCVNFYLQNPHYEALEINPAYGISIEMCMAGLSADKAPLIETINRGLRMIDERELNEIIMNYTIMNPYRLTLSDFMYKYRLALMVIAVLLGIVFSVLAALGAYKRRTNRALQAAYDQGQAALALAEKASAAKGTFMSRMSHEIRTPLNAVIGYNCIARGEMAGVKDEKDLRIAATRVMDCLTKSDIASRHLLTIINDVLDMSAIESGKITVARERFDFRSMITALTVLFYSQARAKGVDFKVLFETPADEWFIGDRMRVNQILTNLLSNSVKFTPPGGGITLSIRQQATQEDEAKLRFAVKDTGIGMSAAALEHIWTPFEQADPTISQRYGGTGLGLSITRNLVDLMGGEISVTSEPGVGSAFTVDLTFGVSREQSPVKPYDFAGIKALVVDDDANALDYVKALMDRCGVRCVCAASGGEALAALNKARDASDPFTLCLLDWQMPDMDGVEIARRVRDGAGGDMPIVILTAYDYSAIEAQAREVGVNRFLAKPLFQSSLFDMLADISGADRASVEKADVRFDFAGVRVLLAEDNAMNMEIARRILTASGLTVDCAWNGKQAVDLFEASPAGTYGAILMDIQMPVMNGHQAARAIRASAHPDAAAIPIIAMTADAFAGNVAEARASGMDEHIAKPIDVKNLLGTLHKFTKQQKQV